MATREGFSIPFTIPEGCARVHEDSVFDFPKSDENGDYFQNDIVLHIKTHDGFPFDLSEIETPTFTIVGPSNKPKPRKKRAGGTKPSKKRRRTFYKERSVFDGNVSNMVGGEVTVDIKSTVKRSLI